MSTKPVSQVWMQTEAEIEAGYQLMFRIFYWFHWLIFEGFEKVEFPSNIQHDEISYDNFPE